jgi:hypothetical protein
VPAHPTPEELSEYAFSPETATAGLREHTAGCATCAAELTDLRLVLATLAELPQPEPPAQVGIRLDAAIARAWQEADAESRTSAAAPASRRRRVSWGRIARPVGALGVLAVAGAGIGLAVSHGSESTSSSASGGAARASSAEGGGGGDAALTQWVRSLLPAASASGPAETPAKIPQHGQGTSADATHAPCSAYPQRAGYTVLATAEQDFDGGPATLVVYQNGKGPASPTVLAVVYAGPCPTASSRILDQGLVSR